LEVFESHKKIDENVHIDIESIYTVRSSSLNTLTKHFISNAVIIKKYFNLKNH